MTHIQKALDAGVPAVTESSTSGRPKRPVLGANLIKQQQQQMVLTVRGVHLGNGIR
eukprot:CAMPEP_0171634116 /NCGR_PEP_ID=MMETSP0990-20121206/25696_1 /TAXON_ID=483369 /ORGANISM="non described non described, Strain CCMP2098" /LENGTH=55 /DNA_ID=CAMNT_0012205141 /DNA_START=289 /DNA_END=456 /DNA_ORIENTATION=-